VLVVFEANRIGREMGNNLNVEQKIASAGVRFFEASSGRDLTIRDSRDKIGRAVDGFSSERVIDETSDRVRRAQRDRWASGHVVGGKVFGYTNVTTVDPVASAKMKHPVKNSRRVIDEREAAVVRRIFELVASGRGFEKVRDILKTEGAPSPRGRGWTAKGVKLVVLRSDYKGVEVRGRTVRVRREGPDGLRWYQVPSENAQQRPCPAVVSEKLWDAAHARIARTARAVAKPDGTVRPSSGLAAPNLLSGFLLCGRCHGSMTILNFRSTHGAPALKYLVCSNFHRRGSKGGDITKGGRFCDSGARVPYATIEEQIVQAFTKDKLVKMVNEFYEAEKARRSPDAVRAQRDALMIEIKKLDTEISNLAQAIALGGNIPALVSKLQQAQSAHDAADATLAGLAEPSSDAAWTPEWLFEAEDGRLESDDPSDRREYDFDLPGMLHSDVDRARNFLTAFLHGERIIVTPTTMIVGGVEATRFDYEATGDMGALVGNLLTWRKIRTSRKPDLVHNPVLSPG
jgi:site-specific DNA recombinase